MTYAAIVVLPHIFFPDDGPISAETCARLDLATSLWRDQVAPRIVTSGWAGLVSKITIADAMAAHLVERGVPTTAVTRERHGRDTVGDAVFTARLHLGAVLVVTSEYHVRRAQEVFSFVYGGPVDVQGVPWTGDEAKERRSVQTFRETFQGVEPGDEVAIYERLRSRHPFYNGEVFAAIPPVRGRLPA